VLLEQAQKLNRELLATLSSSLPDSVEISNVAEVLSDGNREIEIKNSVPPVARHEDSISRVLNSFNPVWNFSSAVWTFLLFKAWQNEVEVLDGLVVFPSLDKVLATDKVLGYHLARWDHQPPLVAADARVPR
jgi:hypothetical protein